MPKQSSMKRTIAARKNGKEGGFERADRHHTIVLSEWSRWGGKAVLAKYGPDYFKELRKRRTHYPKYTESPVIQMSPRVLAGKSNGRKGGMRRAQLWSPESLQAMARLGGIATRTLYGNEFFKEIRKLRKHYRKGGYITSKTKLRIRQEAIRQSKIEPNWAIAALWSAVAKTWE